MNASSSLLCDVNDSTLLVVDVQTRLSDSMPNKVMERIIENTSLLLKSATILEIPTIATEQYPRGLGDFIPDIQQHMPENTLKFQKTCFSCCGNEDFMTALRTSGRKQVIVTGMEAHVCVLQTAIELIEHGFDVFIAGDSICSRRLDNYQNALDRLDRAGGILISTESIVFEWLRDAQHDKFKEIALLLS